MIKIKVIQFNKYKNKHKDERMYEHMHRYIDYAKENNIDLALCFKIEDVDDLFCDINENFKIQAVTTNRDITNRLSKINYVDLSDEEY